jgi:hypothetical protein
MTSTSVAPIEKSFKTVDDFLFHVGQKLAKYHAQGHNDVRFGQTLMNELFHANKELYSKIHNTGMDIYYEVNNFSEKFSKVYEFLYTNWR